MTLRDCIESVGWPEVRDRLVALYGGDESGIDTADYEDVFAQLRRLTPLPQTMRLVIRPGPALPDDDAPAAGDGADEEDGDGDADGDDVAGLPGHQVVGHDGTLCVEEDPDLYGGDPRGQEEVAWGLVFTPWQEWLGMDLDRATLDAYAPADIVAHCLWEMTFYGFDQASIREQAQRFESALGDGDDDAGFADEDEDEQGGAL